MPGTAASYISRLSEALRACAEIAGGAGYVTARELAERMGVSDRMARNYLIDLLEAGALEYVGGGRYVLTGVSRQKLLEGETLGEPFDIEAVAAAGLGHRAVLEFMLDRVYRVMDAAKKLGDREGLRRALLQAKPPEPFAGDRLVYSSRHVEPREVRKLTGEACASHLEGYVLAKLIPLVVVYVCSVAAVVELSEYGQVKSVEYLRRPDIRGFRSGEPFDEGLVELALEHPELLLAGRKMAARLLAARLKLMNMLDAIEKGADLAVSRGTLLPHGFVLPGSELLRELQRDIEGKYALLLAKSRERGVAIASIVEEPRDTRFYESVRPVLGLKLPRVSDAAFLAYVLEPWEYTAPMALERERGRSVENWYEFYWRVGNRLVKVEYTTADDPLAAQRALIAVLAPNMQVGGRPVGVAEAYAEAQRHLRWIKEAFKLALSRAAG